MNESTMLREINNAVSLHFGWGGTATPPELESGALYLLCGKLMDMLAVASPERHAVLARYHESIAAADQPAPAPVILPIQPATLPAPAPTIPVEKPFVRPAAEQAGVASHVNGSIAYEAPDAYPGETVSGAAIKEEAGFGLNPPVAMSGNGNGKPKAKRAKRGACEAHVKDWRDRMAHQAAIHDMADASKSEAKYESKGSNISYAEDAVRAAVAAWERSSGNGCVTDRLAAMHKLRDAILSATHMVP